MTDIRFNQTVAVVLSLEHALNLQCFHISVLLMSALQAEKHGKKAKDISQVVGAWPALVEFNRQVGSQIATPEPVPDEFGTTRPLMPLTALVGCFMDLEAPGAIADIASHFPEEE